MLNHTLQIDNELWSDLVNLTGIPHDKNRAILNKARILLRETVTIRLEQQRNNKPKPAALSTFSPQPQPKPIIRHHSWPLSPDAENFVRSQGLSLELFRPCDDYDEEEEQHLEDKKFWIRDGWKYEGMNDPIASLSHALGDIESRRVWSELGEGAQAAHRAARGKYRTWKLRRQQVKF
jgi:hypothetical protein